MSLKQVRNIFISLNTLVVILILLTLLNGCVCFSLVAPFTCDAAYSGAKWEGNEAVRFTYRQNKTTPRGIKVDDRSGEVDLNKIDEIAERVASCLSKRHKREIRVTHCGLRVLIAPDWTTVNGVEIFSFNNSEYTGALQNPATAVSSPNLKSLGHEFAHLFLGDSQHNEDTRICGDMIF